MSSIAPLFDAPEALSSTSGKAELPAETPPRTPILMTQVSVTWFPHGTKPKLHNIHLTLKMVKEIINILDSSMVSVSVNIPG